jgi:hypothetical protein
VVVQADHGVAGGPVDEAVGPQPLRFAPGFRRVQRGEHQGGPGNVSGVDCGEQPGQRVGKLGDIEPGEDPGGELGLAGPGVGVGRGPDRVRCPVLEPELLAVGGQQRSLGGQLTEDQGDTGADRADAEQRQVQREPAQEPRGKAEIVGQRDRAELQVAVEDAAGRADARRVFERLRGAEGGGGHRAERVPGLFRPDDGGGGRGDVRAVPLRYDPDDAAGGGGAEVDADCARHARGSVLVHQPVPEGRRDAVVRPRHVSGSPTCAASRST